LIFRHGGVISRIFKGSSPLPSYAQTRTPQDKKLLQVHNFSILAGTSKIKIFRHPQSTNVSITGIV